MADDLKELTAELRALSEVAGSLTVRLGSLSSDARRLGAHGLGRSLLILAEAIAHSVPTRLDAAALRIEQARRGLHVSPVSAELAAGRCRKCLGLPTALHPHEDWCPDVLDVAVTLTGGRHG